MVLWRVSIELEVRPPSAAFYQDLGFGFRAPGFKVCVFDSWRGPAKRFPKAPVAQVVGY